MTFAEEIDLAHRVDAQVGQLTPESKAALLGYLTIHDAQVVEHALDDLHLSKRCLVCGALVASDGSHISAMSGAHIPAEPEVTQ